MRCADGTEQRRVAFDRLRVLRQDLRHIVGAHPIRFAFMRQERQEVEERHRTVLARLADLFSSRQATAFTIRRHPGVAHHVT